MVSKNSIDQIVDQFVERVNTSYREPVQISDTPPSVLHGAPDEYGFSDWRIKPFSNVDWVESLEKKLDKVLPYSYRSLVSRYIFPAFEAAKLFFFANTPEGTDYYEFRTRLFNDTLLYKALYEGGYLQFAQPADRDYDPICFDLNVGSEVDCPIVRIDHEYILCDSIVKVTNNIAPSFINLLL